MNKQPIINIKYDRIQDIEQEYLTEDDIEARELQAQHAVDVYLFNLMNK